MLSNIPNGINAITRNVVIRHPNTFNCEFYRRQVLRNDPVVGERPAIGGMMVLSVDDEVEIEWAAIGIGYALAADLFQPSMMMDRGDANNGSIDEYRFLIESDKEAFEGGFEPKKDDVFYIVLGNIQDEKAPRLAYEIVAIESTVNIPPYVPRYICNRRDDLIPHMNSTE